jgi:hypothetical protein
MTTFGRGHQNAVRVRKTIEVFAVPSRSAKNGNPKLENSVEIKMLATGA